MVFKLSALLNLKVQKFKHFSVILAERKVEFVLINMLKTLKEV